MPPADVRTRICQRRELIVASAARADLDPAVMTACLLAEHTFLVNTSDSLIDLLARLRIHGNPSLGFVQMRLSTARQVQREIFRADKTDEEIIADLLDDTKAFHYMAALIKHDQKVFKSNGIDIGGDAGILCSLYLIGRAKERAARHRANGTHPRMNYYGFFAAMHVPLAEKILTRETCADDRLAAR